MIELGWTRDEVLDQVDDPFLDALAECWREYPPLRKFVALALGHKPRPPPKRIDEQSARELLAMFPGGAIR